jgi:H+/gluconate symporter-like permease
MSSANEPSQKVRSNPLNSLKGIGLTRVGEWFGRRFWESRSFYSSYIALFIAITNWITIQYALLLNNIPSLTSILPNIWYFMIVAVIVFSIVGVLGGHYIHRKRQFRLEQALAIEENPYLYKAAPGKERNLMVPIVILQLESLEQILLANNALTETKRKQFELYRQSLVDLVKGHSIAPMG